MQAVRCKQQQRQRGRGSREQVDSNLKLPRVASPVPTRDVDHLALGRRGASVPFLTPSTSSQTLFGLSLSLLVSTTSMCTLLGPLPALMSLMSPPSPPFTTLVVLTLPPPPPLRLRQRTTPTCYSSPSRAPVSTRNPHLRPSAAHSYTPN